MKKVYPVLILFILLFFNVCRAGEARKFKFPFDSDKLLNGELQIFESVIECKGKAKKKHLAGIIMINAPPAEVWEVLTDWESMDEFVPDLEYYKVIINMANADKNDTGQSFVEGKLEIPLFDFIFTLDITHDQSNYLQKWRLMTPEEIQIYRLVGMDLKNSTDGIDSIEGYGQIEPVDDGLKSVYTYSTEIEFSMPLPEFVENHISRNALAGFMEGVKKRVESQGLYMKDTFSFFPR